MIGAEITQSQLVVSGLTMATAAVIAVLKLFASGPEREAEAYRRGIADEAARCAEDMAELKARFETQGMEINQLRAALMRLAVAADLTPNQRKEIAGVLGYQRLPESGA